MKRFELAFAFLQLPVDYLMLFLAGLTAYYLRFSTFFTEIRPVIFKLSFNDYSAILTFVALGWVIIFAFAGLYSTNPNRKLSNELNKVVLACSTGFAAITIYVFFTLQKFDSRFLVLAGGILAVAYVSVGRIAIRLIKILCYKFEIGLRKTVIIGTEEIAEKIKIALDAKPYFGYKIIGYLRHFDAQKLSALGKIDEIIFADPKGNENDAFSAIDYANEKHITFKYSADLFATISSNIAISTIAGIPVIEMRRTRLVGWWKIAKRLMDIIGSIFFIILFSPIYIISAIIIYIETGTPILYKNERVGQEGEKFFAYKFRSMRQQFCTGAQFVKNGNKALKFEDELIQKQNIKTGPVYKIKNDPRVTKFGKFMRMTSIDELPQFFNVLFGSMSLVGPRPHQPREVNKYEKWHKTVLAINPGITGLAQISGRSDLLFDEEARLDIFYIEHWNIFLDIIILIKTPFIVFRRKGAL
jgi:exopolysaccharide biosynthesis polyprenyl glycosylphosphotransferase